MSVDLSKLIVKRPFELEELGGKVVAIDAYNMIYQFLSIIRQPDGMPLMDSKGRVTSHLSGLLYRNAELMDKGIRLVYVFDGVPSMLKQKTIEARMNARREAYEAWKGAVEKGDMEAARTHAQASTRITKEIVASSKELLGYMGIPVVNAPSEGEAQASHMCKEGVVYAVGSQDYDTLLLGAPRVVRNLTISGRRKLPGKNIYVNVQHEMVTLKETLESLGISYHQLVWLGMLLGTDFNEGIDKVGPKTALKIAKQASSLDDIVRHVKEKYNAEFEVDPKTLEGMFVKPEVKEFGAEDVGRLFEISPDRDKIVKFMCDEHEFGADRVQKIADRLAKAGEGSKQKGLGKWL